MRSGDEVGMLSLPSQPSGLRERFFHNRRGIDEDLHVARETRNQELSKMFQSSLNNFMIILVSSINRNGSFAWLTKDAKSVVLRRVGEADDDYTSRLGPETFGAASLLRSSREPTHVAVEAGLNKLAQSFPDFRTKAGSAEANGIETHPQCILADLASGIIRARFGRCIPRLP